MPRTIWQKNETQYIGDQIWTFKQGSPSLAPVWDHERNDWVRLNAIVDTVDYILRDVLHDRVTVDWTFHWDYQQMRITLTRNGQDVAVYQPPANPTQFRLTGLDSETTYEINVQAILPWGITQPYRQTFRTGKDPIPAQVMGLRYTARTNSSISLSWSAVPGTAYYAIYRATPGRAFERVARSYGSTTATVKGLMRDTKYRFIVRAVNYDGRAGPASGELRSATGHDAVVKKGRTNRIVLPPKRWGSWRSDIKWLWWATYPGTQHNRSIYQGYWAYTSKRYWGLIEYDDAQLRRIINNKFGSGVADNFNVTQASIKRIYRQRMPGNVAPQQLEWHLAGSKVATSSARPTIFEKHVNDRNSADARANQRSLGAGRGIDMLRIPRSWGQGILKGRKNGKNVTGLALHRGDNQWNGYGYAGYCKISGHNEPDYHLGGGGGRQSDLSLVLAGNWNVQTRSYKKPYDW